ncbi:MAG TPA: S41 family peptidase, partial [Flavobacterium sp.]|nr:S41 family peptidase [Flavobacterium sp.]
GIRAGDRILYAGNTRLYGKKWPTDSLYKYLKGEEGSKVTLTVYRKSENKKFKVQVTRDVIPIKSVDAAVMLQDNLGYIKINRFAETTYHEFMEGLTQLQKKGMQKLVIDVRDNSGGYMEKAIEIADELLPNQDLIVFTKNRKGRVDKTFATKKGVFETGPVYVLINENSASASEILAGAVQDNDRGTVIGRRSFGKGLVQREMDFGDGSAVRLTVARYYTPSGRSIQKPYTDQDAYFSEFGHRFESGELYHKDSIRIADTLKFKTKRGRTVFGGGGIVPDVFVPLEDAHMGDGIPYLMQSGVVGHFVFEQLDRNRKAFAGKSYPAFLEQMNSGDGYVLAFREYLAKNGVELDL